MLEDEIRDKIIRGMRAAGLRLTSQRLAIVDVLVGTRTHPSAAAVYARAKKTAPTVSLSTVYLTLDVLKRAGLIRELEFADRDSCFEVDVADHLNLVCRECGSIEDFPAAPPVAAARVEKNVGFKVNEVRLEYYGSCRRCRSKKIS